MIAALRRETTRPPDRERVPDRALLELSATALARGIRDGRWTSRQVVDAHIARAEQVNPWLTAIVADRYDAARAEADAADAAVRAGAVGPDRPLHGVPCTIKESFAVAGMPWTAGHALRRGTVAERDAVTVARLRAAGAIVLGVTNTSELCMWMESSNPVYGRTSNAYHPHRIAGGSSGGEGAIVGAGASPFGLGADIGGSIRMPAFFNGVFGHKPGTGVIPNSGQYPISKGDAVPMLSTGPLCRRAEDLGPLVRILAGPDGEDPRCLPDPFGDPASVDVSRLTVLDVPDNGWIGVDPGLRAAQAGAAACLAAHGARVRVRRIPGLRRSFDIWSAAMGANEGPGAYRHLLERTWRDLLKQLLLPWTMQHTIPSVVLGLVEDINLLMPGQARFALAEAQVLRENLIEAIGDGVMLFPPYPILAPDHHGPLLRPFHWVYTAILNVMGLPVTSVPLGLDAKGRPLGVQVVGAPGRDHVTIAVAMHLERALGGWVPPWSTDRARER